MSSGVSLTDSQKQSLAKEQEEAAFGKTPNGTSNVEESFRELPLYTSRILSVFLWLIILKHPLFSLSRAGDQGHVERDL